MDNPPSSVLDLIQRIRERPGMYIAWPSIRNLQMFLAGCDYGRREAGAAVEDRFLAGFDDWVRERFKIRSSHGWASIIEFYGQSEQGAWDLFCELLDKYLAQCPLVKG